MTTYTLLVKFERDLEDDEECIRLALEKDGKAFGDVVRRERLLVAQFCKELQAAYDCMDCGLSGHFVVVEEPKLATEIAFEDWQNSDATGGKEKGMKIVP